jgi:hypothetical protein
MRVSVSGMIVRTGVVVMFVPVVPQLGLVEQKKEDHANQQREEQALRINLTFESLGQQMQKGRAQQGTSGQAEHMLCIACQHAEAQGRSQPYAANAGSQRSQQDCYQSHSLLCVRFKVMDRFSHSLPGQAPTSKKKPPAGG